MPIPVLTPVEEDIAFHMAIGRAVSQWAHIENGLYNLNVLAFGKTDWKVLGAAFHSIENFRAKLAFTDSAIKHASAFSSLLPQWADASKLASQLSVVRNKIAHCRTIVFPSSPPGRNYAIVPINHDEAKFKSRNGLPPSSSLCVRDIDLAARQFSRAALILSGLREQAAGMPPSIPVPPEPQRQTLVQLRHQIELIHLQRAPKPPR